MEYIQYTKFRNNAKKYFYDVEHGKSYIIIKKGQPVAQVIPISHKENLWRKRVKKVELLKTEKNTTDFIREERSL